MGEMEQADHGGQDDADVEGHWEDDDDDDAEYEELENEPEAEVLRERWQFRKDMSPRSLGHLAAAKAASWRHSTE